ncbi:septal ring lytic transglycosylase RlpA family protein [Acidocella sp.]|uniref:septal ring lytic transglycosylase RlpA family protein n=1 Tax=Acidocella sp. TaxID=50710 RepID=UPI00262822DD|nr:septal ring lytic transglycosylase RlpA family protein [Acidocella sp.]
MDLTAPTPCGMPASARRRFAPVLATLLLAGLAACASSRPPALAPQAMAVAAPVPASPPPPRAPALVATGPELSGTASWYRPGRGLHRTCTGESFNGEGMTAASHTIPVGTRVRVALADDTAHSIVVRVNDCMPRGSRLLDLSRGAAEELGLVDLGVAEVSVTPVMLVDNR